MNVSSKITQKLAALLIMTAGVYMSSEFADTAFVRAASETMVNLEVGQPAPDFTLPDTNGKTQTLSKFKGKLVVLEWFNDDCPFVQRHYQVGNMQALQKEYTSKGVVWLSIISSAEGPAAVHEKTSCWGKPPAKICRPTATRKQVSGSVRAVWPICQPK